MDMRIVKMDDELVWIGHGDIDEFKGAYVVDDFYLKSNPNIIFHLDNNKKILRVADEVTGEDLTSRYLIIE
jgi:hypothetical protein